MSKSDRPQRLGVRRPGLTAHAAAKKVGRSPRTIRRWTAEPREDFIARAHEKRDKIQSLHDEGMTMRAIAKEVGCSVGTVHRYVHMKNQASA